MDDYDIELMERMDRILTATANALHGGPHPGGLHSWHDLPELVEKLRKERDEARRLLKAVVDMMRDNMAHDATHPHHLCDFIHRPDIGMCKVCEDWTDAMVMCYPDDFQDEEDGK